jgi:hypothetical protein
MDTDDLSIEAYTGIIVEADKFNHDLTLQFGLIAGDCLSQDEYLESAIELMEELNTRIQSKIYLTFFMTEYLT